METRFLSGGARQAPGPAASQPSSLLDHTASGAAHVSPWLPGLGDITQGPAGGPQSKDDSLTSKLCSNHWVWRVGELPETVLSPSLTKAAEWHLLPLQKWLVSPRMLTSFVIWGSSARTSLKLRESCTTRTRGRVLVCLFLKTFPNVLFGDIHSEGGIFWPHGRGTKLQVPPGRVDSPFLSKPDQPGFLSKVPSA